jgi:valyl-tRNA synthetase
MARELSKAYEPKQVEAKWYPAWEEQGYFHADVDPSRPAYCITIPPPNVTGELHMGHALQHSIHDLIIRRKRMQGFNALCLPGTDHASISTQMKVVNWLREQGIDRHEIGREKFVEYCWQWTEKYGGTILRQLRSLGCSYDWRRTRFTLDAGYHRAVLEAFVQFYEKGWIYRGLRVINWCTECRTSVSDLEIIHKDVTSHFWHIRYPLEDGSGHVVVATTRPETMLGDTAVAVNPKDDRYQHLVGKNAILPLMNRPIPIIADDYVDVEEGTGALKVTPAHDPNDYEIGRRHNLPLETVIGKDGLMTAEAGEFVGLDLTEARRRVVAALEAQGLLEQIVDHARPVGHHDRCGTLLEPLPSEQWFMKMEELARLTLAAINEGRVRFIPERYKPVAVQRLENERDWNISRQLWWGQRIPVWTCGSCEKPIVQVEPPTACPNGCSGPLEQDPDVFDTWFSSALWPFATLGWPEPTPELGYFYPTDLLITARDIIFLWVNRMIMTSEEFLRKEPFHDVLVHATVLTGEGKRMSKSLGTGVDPQELIDKYGADATRFSLANAAGDLQDIRFAVDFEGDEVVRAERCELARNFCNKLWNASRFVLLSVSSGQWAVSSEDAGQGTPETPEPAGQLPTAHCPLPTEAELRAAPLELADRWVLSRLEATVEAVNSAVDAYSFDEACRALYDFLWTEFCDWYVELAKPRLSGRQESAFDVRRLLVYALERTLRLAHPFLPFITEEIRQSLPGAEGSIMVAAYPEAQPAFRDDAAEARMTAAMEVIRAIRNLRQEMAVPPGKVVEAYMAAGADALEGEALGYVQTLARVTLRLDAPEGQTVNAVAAGVEIRMAVGDLVDKEKESARLRKEIAEIDKELARVGGKLGNEQFLARAPAEVVEKERGIQRELSEKRAALEQRLAVFGG